MKIPRLLLLPFFAVLIVCSITGNPSAHAEDCTDLEVLLLGPKTTLPGEEIGTLVTALVRNTGNTPADEFSVEFYLSGDREADEDDILLAAGTEHEGGLDAGSSLSVTVSEEMRIPSDISTGNWFLMAVVNEQPGSTDCNETGNIHATPITIPDDCPDLAVSLTAPPGAAPDQEIGSLVSARVENTGRSAAELFIVGFYLSEDDMITTDDLLLVEGRASEDGLGAAGSLSVEIAPGMRIPADVAPGDYYLGVIVDEQAMVEECSEFNNTHALPIHIGIPDCFTGDLVVSIPGFGFERQGLDLTVSNHVEITNRGSGEIGEFSVGMYLFDREIPDASPILFPGGRRVVEGLNPGASVSLSIDSGFEAPPHFTLPRGRYDLGVQVDDLDSVVECDETNNRAVNPLCDPPTLFSSMKLVIPGILVETAEGNRSIWAELQLVPFEGGSAFELVKSDGRADIHDATLCPPITLTLGGALRIPRLTYREDPEGWKNLSVDLQLVEGTENKIFEIIAVQHLP